MSKKILILSIDGGGIRGIIPAQFLAQLEQDLSNSLYDTFDMYAGTSVGSYIALGISALKYNGKQLIDIFNRKNINTIFTKSFLSFFSIIYGAKYSGKSKRKILDKIFADKHMLDIEKLTLITSYDFIAQRIVVFKSYPSTDTKYNPTVAEVADASSAAPTYFPSVKSSSNPTRWLVDGGLAANNPSVAILSTAIHQGHKLDDIKILSIGTGSCDQYKNDAEKVGKASQHWGALGWFTHGIIDNFTTANMDATEYAVGELLKEYIYRVDHPLTIASDSIDNISDSNLAALHETGKQWYQQHRESLLQWLKEE